MMLIDSNILIYSLSKRSPKRSRAQNFLNETDDLVFAQQNILETLRVLTHPIFPDPMKAEEALQAVSAIIDVGVVIRPTPETLEIMIELIRRKKITGNTIFDAYLVATMLSNGVKKIATDNVKHFKKFEEITRKQRAFARKISPPLGCRE